MPVAFIETPRFPETISYGSGGGPAFMTTVFEGHSGVEQRGIEWNRAKARYEVSLGVRDAEDMDLVRALFYNVRGRAIGFRFKDWSDYQLDQEVIGEGDGNTAVFRITKTYTHGSESYVRRIFKPINDAFVVRVNGVVQTPVTHYNIDFTTGTITFVATKETGSFAFATTAEVGDELTVDDGVNTPVTFEFVASGASTPEEVNVGASANASAINLAAKINDHPDLNVTALIIVPGTITITNDNYTGGSLTEDVDGGGDITTTNFSGFAGFLPGAGHDIDVTGEFDVPARFDTDQLEPTHEGFLVEELGSIPVVEILLEDPT